MTPPERFEAWMRLSHWALGIHVDFMFKSISICVGPFGAAFNWGKL